jgi:hypothetical protein
MAWAIGGSLWLIVLSQPLTARGRGPALELSVVTGSVRTQVGCIAKVDVMGWLIGG